MTDATDTRPGIDPDRTGFTIALHAAHDQVVQAAGVIADTVALVGAIARLILANLLPDPRAQTSPRVIKQAISIQHPKHRRPDQLQSHHRHRHPRPTKPLTNRTNA
jgi:hypothetical protein